MAVVREMSSFMFVISNYVWHYPDGCGEKALSIGRVDF